MNTSIPSVLQRIIQTKVEEIKQAQANLSLTQLIKKSEKVITVRRGFANALREARNKQKIGIIAEIKKASPSKGLISPNFDPIKIAKGYQLAGATCLSVLTDVQYFQGADEYLIQARNSCQLPVLRKDFMIDEYQVYQSYLLGADCILLIMACLDDKMVYTLQQLAIKLGMDVLIEVHTQQELERSLTLPRSKHNIYGINNRDLNTFEVDLQHSIHLKEYLVNELTKELDTELKDALIVSESGIHSADDITLMMDNDISTFLIGEQFMKTEDPSQQLASLLGEFN